MSDETEDALVLVSDETLALRMEYLKWCDLAYERLMKSWADLVVYTAVLMVLLGIAVTGIALVVTHGDSKAIHQIGLVCLTLGLVGIGVPLGACIRIVLDIKQDKKIFASYMRSARENVVMRNKRYMS